MVSVGDFSPPYRGSFFKEKKKKAYEIGEPQV